MLLLARPEVCDTYSLGNTVATMDSKSLTCKVCGAIASPLDAVDFNKSCEEARGKFLQPRGILILYALCPNCGFCFAPEMAKWTLAEFEERVYNKDYVLIDPDYVEDRPRGSAASLLSAFDNVKGSFKHLDYGGGRGLLAKILRESQWDSVSYDPFVDRNTDIKKLGTFDLITAYEVFEHVPDVQTLMSDLCSLLSPTGIILFSTVVSDGEIAPNKPVKWWYASPRNGHISLFSRNSLEVLARQSGFLFRSFSPGFHTFLRTIPPWAAHVIKMA